MFRLSMSLFAVALICALTLALIYQKTSPVIEQQKQMLLERSLQSVLPADSYQKQEGEILYYEAKNAQNNLIGWALPLSGKGYGGNIQLLVGVDTKENITGVQVLEHSETPGLGSKINEIEYKQTEAKFLKQFKDKNIQDIVLIKGKTDKNIQAITGATISSKAVVDGVRQGVDAFLKSKQEK
ncbi:MAG: RnfABCDGE type electron transport complex subunit G [Candidatus Omnitrophica bacterium]|nr:RnfABCDGE type electron transport complex subunit G [Candidatus Omnitrophota bacterium]